MAICDTSVRWTHYPLDRAGAANTPPLYVGVEKFQQGSTVRGEKGDSMSSQTEQTTQGSVSADATMLQTPSNAGRSRLVFVDNLKVALIILVVLHHVAVIYAANTAFYYLEPAYHDTPALVVLVLFQLLN